MISPLCRLLFPLISPLSPHVLTILSPASPHYLLSFCSYPRPRDAKRRKIVICNSPESMRSQPLSRCRKSNFLDRTARGRANLEIQVTWMEQQAGIHAESPPRRVSRRRICHRTTRVNPCIRNLWASFEKQVFYIARHARIHARSAYAPISKLKFLGWKSTRGSMQNQPLCHFRQTYFWIAQQIIIHAESKPGRASSFKCSSSRNAWESMLNRPLGQFRESGFFDRTAGENICNINLWACCESQVSRMEPHARSYAESAPGPFEV